MQQHDGSMCTLCHALIGEACGKMARLAIQQGELGEPIPGGSSHATGVTREGLSAMLDSVSGMRLLSSSQSEVWVGD